MTNYNDSLQTRFTAMHWLVVIMFGAAFVWIDVSKPVFERDNKATKYEVYAFVAGIVGMIWCIVTMCLMHFTNDSNKLLHFVNALLMWIFWTINTGIFTFDSPFTQLKNGWIASWATFVFTSLHLGSVSGFVQEKMSRAENGVRSLSLTMTYVLGAIVTSAIELVAASIICTDFCEKAVAYSVAVGVCGIVFAVLILLPVPDNVKLVVAVINLIWWFVAVLFLTFIEDLFTAGRANGYFATWAAFLFAMLIAFPYFSAFFCKSGAHAQTATNTPQQTATNTPQQIVTDLNRTSQRNNV